MDEHLRLKKLRRSLSLSQGSLAKAIDRKQGSISDIERGRNSVDGILPLLKLAFGVNPEWVKTGKGDTFLPRDSPPDARGAGLDEPGAKGPSREKGVPYFNSERNVPAGGKLPLVNEQPEYYIDFKPFNDCTAYFPYRGDSMYPKYLHGDILAVKEVQNYDMLLWGEAYLIVTDEQANGLRIVRIVSEHADKNKIILRASNPQFSGDIVLDKKSIVALYLVKGRITLTV